jgi:transcriptional regulator with XRE-family HTH domain
MSRVPYEIRLVKDSVVYRIRKIRESKDLSQENVADELGISKGAYSKIETGKTDPSISRLYQLAEVFEVSVTEFFEKDIKKVKTEDHIPQYGFASKGDIEEVVKMIQSLAKEVSLLKTTIEEIKTPRKKSATKK